MMDIDLSLFNYDYEEEFDIEVDDTRVEVSSGSVPLEWTNDIVHEFTESTKLDGLLIVFSHLACCRPAGRIRLIGRPRILYKTKSSFKGITLFPTDTTRIYEIPLFYVGDFTSSVLVLQKGKMRNDQRPSFLKMWKSVHEAFSEGIKSLSGTKSNEEFYFQTGNEIAVDNSDWPAIASIITTELDIQKQRNPDHFPPTPEFLFCMSVYGNNAVVATVKHQLSNHFYCENLYEIATHIAFDFDLKDYILWWKPNIFLSACNNIYESKTFRVGILPGIGNVQLKFALESDSPCKEIQVYTRKFNSAHHNKHELFMKPVIANHFANCYNHLMRGQTVPTSKKHLSSGSLMSYIKDAIVQCSGYDGTARLEYVHSTKNANSVLNAIEEAVHFCQFNKEQTFTSEMIYAMSSSEFGSRTKNWEPYFHKYIVTVAEKFEHFSGKNPQHLILETDPKLLVTKDEILVCAVLEYFINFFLLGGTTHSFKKNFMEVICDFKAVTTISSGETPKMNPWPLPNVLRKPENGLEIHVSVETLNELGRFLGVDEVPCEQLKLFRLLPSLSLLERRDPCSTDYYIVHEVADVFLQLLFARQYEISGFSRIGSEDITLKMLFGHRGPPETNVITVNDFGHKIFGPDSHLVFHEHKTLSFILAKLSTKIPKVYKFKEIVISKLILLMIEQVVSLRITATKSKDFYVVLPLYEHPDDTSAVQIWSHVLYRRVLPKDWVKSKVRVSELVTAYVRWNMESGRRQHNINNAMKAVLEIVTSGSMDNVGQLPDSLRQRFRAVLRLDDRNSNINEN